jgi:hypothetical protein
MRLTRIIALIKEESAAETAHRLKLQYAGYGVWKDASGKSVAKTVNGQLVKLEPGEVAQPSQGGGDEPPSDLPKSEPSASDNEPKKELTAQEIMGKKIGGAQGTNQGGFYEGTDGVKRYVKMYKDPSRSHAEALCGQIYKDLGIGAPNTQTFDLNGSTAFASDIIEGKELNQAGIDKETCNKILDGFCADVLTGNWDSVGLEWDNVLVTPEKETYRIDNGGSFMFRAMESSGRKPDHLLNDISEWEVFPTKNSAYARVFKTAGYPNADSLGSRIKDQVKKIAELEKNSGGWDNYVNQHAAKMDEKDRQTAIQMLKSRSKKLYQKATSL